MSSLTVATGVWPAIVLAAVILTAVITPLLLAAYRRATIRGMARGEAGEAAARDALTPAPARPDLDVRRVEGSAPRRTGALYSRAMASLRRLQLVYLLAGSAYVLVIVTAWMLIAGDGFPPGRFLWLFACYAWPLVLTLGLIGALGRRDWLVLVAGYLAGLLAAGAFVLERNPDVTLQQAGFLWLFANAVPSLIWLGVLNHRIRAVGPLVLTMAFAGSAAALGVLAAAGSNEALLGVLARPLLGLGVGAEATFTLLALIPFLLGIALSLIVVRAIGRRYQRKRLSAQSIMIDCLWLLFALWQPITLAFEDLRYMLAGPLGFAAYLAVRRLVLPITKLGSSAHSPRILLLRVFALDKASRRLFDLWSRPWLRIGSISMISGPDLATTAVEPQEFLAFLGGRLSREFITDPAQIDERMSRYDPGPDPDGNHRVNDYFCQNHTWRAVVERLARDADTVIMDLRRFRRGNDGCAWEIGQLLERVDLDRVLLLVDADTDLAHLEHTLHERWQLTSADSPNLTRHAPCVRLLAIDALGRATVRRVFSALERR